MGELRTEVVEGLNETPALDLAVRGWAEVQEKGLGDGAMNCFPWLDAVIGYAMNGRDELPVGVLTFRHDVDQKRIWVNQAFVLVEFRGNGVYRAMWAALIERAGSLDAKSIQMGTHVRNLPMRAVGQKTGCAEEFVVLRFNL